MTTDTNKYALIAEKAALAGVDAVSRINHTPTPFGCGFASIRFRGNTAFGRWALKVGIARKSTMGGLYINVAAYGQSVVLKAAFAEAFAEVLRANGIDDAYATSRLD
jgi:hypothetical protein